MKSWLVLLLLSLTCLGGLGARAQEPLPFKLASRPSMNEVRRFRGADRDHLVYELFLENFEKQPLRLEVLQIQLQKDGKTVFSTEVRGEALAKSFTGLAGNYLKAQDPTIPSGGGAILFVFLDLPERTPAADAILNQVVVTAQDAPTSRKTQGAGKVSISALAAPILAPPLKGKGWWTFNAPANNSIHRRIIIPFEGPIWAPERLASDWLRLDDQGRNFAGPKDQNKSYFAYGAEILAVADGLVVAVKDGIPENIPQGPTMAVPITLETIGGNHVLQDIGGGLYAFYAHLQPGSPKVKVGEVLKTGQAIGLLGNSGNSTEPHLHFHVIDHPDPLKGQGMPYLLTRFLRVKSDIVLNEDDDIVRFKAYGAKPVEHQAYMNLELVEFP